VEMLLQVLLALQQIDDKLSAIGQKKKEIPERLRGMEQALLDEKQGLEEHRQRLKEAHLRQRTLEKQLQASAEERKNKQKRLLEVKTNEEYKALLKEIDYAKQADSAAEDQILALLEEIDSIEKAMKESEKSAREQEIKFQEEKKRLEGEVVEIDREQNFLKRERERICRELDPEVLKDYEKIRARRSGQAVVVIRDEVCPGCHMQVPPQTINEVLQTGEIRHCQYCRRILYCELEESA
jgi:predicted  nucleic acid-binding Zn-ribbon protein